jgi:hypothetical protein
MSAGYSVLHYVTPLKNDGIIELEQAMILLKLHHTKIKKRAGYSVLHYVTPCKNDGIIELEQAMILLKLHHT